MVTWQREKLFGEVVDGEVQLNERSQIVKKCWNDAPEHFPQVELDAFVVMPNHIHGIIVIKGNDVFVGATHIVPVKGCVAPTQEIRNTPEIIRGNGWVIQICSCEEREGSPEGFYAKSGFKRTGKMQGEEVVLSLTLE